MRIPLGRSMMLLGALMALGTAGVSGQEATPAAAPSFDGEYVYVAQSRDVIREAIERGIEDMSFVTRPIARRRLRATNEAYAELTLEVTPSEIVTSYDGRAGIRSPANGRAVRWEREPGDVMQVATAVREGALIQTFTAEDGSRENRFTLAPDGRRLTLQVTVRSGRLPAPIVYRLIYDRVR